VELSVFIAIDEKLRNMIDLVHDLG